MNEAPAGVALSASTTVEGAAAGTVVGTLQGVIDPDAGDSHAFSLIDDAGGRFKLVGDALQVADGALVDFESAASHDVTVRVTDAAGLTLDKVFTINVTDVNEAPTGIALSANSVGEGAAADTIVGMLQGVVDPDAGDSHTFSLLDDAGGRFKLVGAELQVMDGALLDFEGATSHTVTVRIADAGGLFYDEDFTIDVTDVNEVPAGVTLSASTTVEGAAAGTVVGTPQGVIDPDASDSHAFSLIDDAGGRFKLVGDAIQVADGALLDFESAASHDVTVRVTDAGGLSYDETFTIDVTDVNEAPTSFVLSAGTVAEDAATGAVIGTLQDVVDPDAGDTYTFSLVDGIRLWMPGPGGRLTPEFVSTDARFKLDGADLLVADGGLFDFENAGSHAVTVRVTDAAGSFFDKTLTIDVTDVNEAPTDFTMSASIVAENAVAGTVVGALAGIVDPDAGSSHTIDLIDNAGGRFALAGQQLQVADGALLDFESATGHTVTVRVTDATGLSLDKAFTIGVTDQNAAPTDVALSASTVAEGAATATIIGTLQGVVDPDAGDTHTFSLLDDAGGRFQLVGDQVQVADGALLDFESGLSHAIAVRVTDDAGLSLDKAFTIDVGDVNEAPTDFILSATTVAEDAPLGTAVGTLQGIVDPDAGDTHSFSLVDDAGGRFQLVGDEIQVANGTPLDFESATSHAVAVQVTDGGGLFFFQAFTINVTDVNEAPSAVALSANTVTEGAPASTIVGTLQDVVDADTGDSHTFSLLDDAGGRFQLTGTEIQVADGALLDFESAESHTIMARVTDEGGLIFDETFTINVEPDLLV